MGPWHSKTHPYADGDSSLDPQTLTGFPHTHLCTCHPLGLHDSSKFLCLPLLLFLSWSMTPPSTYARTLGVTKAGLASVIAESREEEKDADLIGWTRDLRRMSVRGCPVTPACHAGGRAGPALGAGPESSTRSSAPDNTAGLEESPGRWDRDVGRADRSYEPSYTIPTPSASASPEEYGGLSAPASPTSALWLRLLTY